jgi:serine/threonine-protein kinase
VVARALQTYGMFLADGGQITLTAQSDRFTSSKWAGLLESRDLESIRPREFEMIEAGPRIPLTLDCVREP